ncbi:hypothetical protein [Streptomyces sp. KL116D]|uniref:hypothetical protein n=1 Tax=Streptomyces sp. KL116D TaxID=3045152 RepID=UPI0035576568
MSAIRSTHGRPGGPPPAPAPDVQGPAQCHEPRITPIGPADLARTVALHHRCSPQTLWSRYHRAMPDPATYLPTLLTRPGSVHLAVQD